MCTANSAELPTSKSPTLLFCLFVCAMLVVVMWWGGPEKCSTLILEVSERGREEKPLQSASVQEPGGCQPQRGQSARRSILSNLDFLRPHSFPPRAQPQAPVSWATAADLPLSIKSTFSMSDVQDARTSASPSQVHKDRDTPLHHLTANSTPAEGSTVNTTH